MWCFIVTQVDIFALPRTEKLIVADLIVILELKAYLSFCFYNC